MLYLTCTCTTITSVDFAHYGVSRAKDWVSMNFGTNKERKTERTSIMFMGMLKSNHCI